MLLSSVSVTPINLIKNKKKSNVDPSSVNMLSKPFWL